MQYSTVEPLLPDAPLQIEMYETLPIRRATEGAKPFRPISSTDDLEFFKHWKIEAAGPQSTQARVT